MKVHLILRGLSEGTPEGNLFLDHLAGARVSHYDRPEYTERRDEIVEELKSDYAAHGNKSFFIPTGASDEIGMWGYIQAIEELEKDFYRLSMTPDAAPMRDC